jgi:hypothetical protein
MAMKVRRPEYSTVIKLDSKLYVHVFAKRKSFSLVIKLKLYIIDLNLSVAFRSPFDAERPFCQCRLGTLKLKRLSKRLQNRLEGR